MGEKNILNLIDGFISPGLVWLIFIIISIAGLLAIFVLRYHWDKYLYGGEFIKVSLIKNILLGGIGILWVILLLVSIIFSIKF
ncbi:hypothetical protein A3A03_01605 [Candidatus Nomurabacteria bacterium RIFCSPLOWO2_01_FULL_40_18]|uniref:DUF5671 domain-containing protein n=1 Tax=Candidatus Nomurabacteria bacterium RIFCSPLOWO2_01_FULL_40_18 TaxID=1801773 RepID=A0A1F6XKC8_9BACT|nr:MAG: hypothetical protein A3A03_01605 [Candidatus Nomurabacteria bacterium RIFCSPLOWO2_01_FULL_40_18]